MLKESMLKQFFKEERNIDIIENEDGVIFFTIHKQYFFITDLWVRNDRRGKKASRGLVELAMDKAANEGVYQLRAHIEVKDGRVRDKMMLFFSYGVDVEAVENGNIYLKREYTKEEFDGWKKYSTSSK